VAGGAPALAHEIKNPLTPIQLSASGCSATFAALLSDPGARR
jgi:nitrogen fixation/metabolism regulation signal transduction histidine kinase